MTSTDRTAESLALAVAGRGRAALRIVARRARRRDGPRLQRSKGACIHRRERARLRRRRDRTEPDRT